MVRTGLQVLLDRGCDLLKGRKTGLIVNQTAVDAHLVHAADRLRDALGDGLVRLFAPEHGLRGEAQDMIGVEDDRDARTGLPVVSLYGTSEPTLSPSGEALAGLDTLVFDVQDIGSRYYTFQATMLLAARAAARHGVELIVLDRPNPIGGHLVEGNLVEPDFRSFVGIEPVAVRHGLTVGELGRYYAAYAGLPDAPTVVPMDGWSRRTWWEGTGLEWVMPSPNMPTVATATVYPGTCLLEGTNLSEGRGTTRPFELAGAPWIDGEALRESLEAERLPGVLFRAASFRPTFQKHAGRVCGGVQIHVTDREAFLPFATGIAIIQAARALAPERFEWRREVYEFVDDRPAFDLLAGSDRVRLDIEAGRSLAEIRRGLEPDRATFVDRREPVLLYS